MLPSRKELAKKPKTYFTQGLLPKSTDPEQLPFGQKPFSVILREQWVHTVELSLPEELYESIESSITSSISPAKWSRLEMPLAALVASPFLETYVKSGKASMISSGRPGLDSFYTLDSGTLRLELPKELYERAGLVGSAIVNGTHSHTPRRYAIVLDLQQPSMQRGKKGFERIKWSFRNVLNETVTWLFHEKDATKSMESDSSPLDKHKHTNHTASPTVTHHRQIRVPDMRAWSEGTERDADEGMDLLEWFGMLSAQSERLAMEDDIDPYLSRWQVPEPETASIGNIVTLRWHGFLQGGWVRELLLACMAATRTRADAWFAITARSFSSGPTKEAYDGYTILRSRSGEGKESESPPVLRPEFLLWELVSSVNS